MKPANILKILITATFIFLLPTVMEYQAEAILINSEQSTVNSQQEAVFSEQDSVDSSQDAVRNTQETGNSNQQAGDSGQEAVSSQQQAGVMSDYRYPGSQVVSSGENLLKMESSDEEQTITNWYKEKLTSLNMSVKSFITTKANEKVLNKLVTTNQSQQISVEISQEREEQEVQISVIVTKLQK